MKDSKLICGVGINDKTRPSSINGKITKEYNLWLNMLHRCYDPKKHARSPTYVGCSVSDNFKNYSYFYDWCHNQTGFGNFDEDGRDWHLDKDILIRDNKIYSEDNCVFVPCKINMLLVKRDSARGPYPIGVTYSKKNRKFLAHCTNYSGVKESIGCFSKEIDAFLAYKTFKENVLKLAALWNESKIDQRAYNALMSYEVSIAD